MAIRLVHRTIEVTKILTLAFSEEAQEMENVIVELYSFKGNQAKKEKAVKQKLKEQGYKFIEICEEVTEKRMYVMTEDLFIELAQEKGDIKNV